MKINEIIRSKRIAQKLTQEQVAKMLGVSTPAVNKWEKGVSFPDITILPALARLLDTDLNTLLSFKDDLSDQEVGQFINSLSEAFDKENFENGYQKAMVKMQEFPSCYTLIYSCVVMIDAALKQKGKRIKNKAMYEEQIHAYYEQLSHVDDIKIRTFAQRMLIRKYLDEQLYQDAENLLSEIPDRGIDKQQIKADICIAQKQYEEAAKVEEECLLNRTNEIQTILLKLMEIAIQEKRFDDALYYANVSKQSAEVFDLWEYNQHVAHFELYMKQKKRKESIKAFISLMKSITKPWVPNASPLYKHIKTKPIDKDFGKTMQNNIITAMKEDEESAYLQEDEQFQAIIKDYS